MTFLDWVAPRLGYDDPVTARVQPFYEIAGLLHWVFFCVLGYLVIPALWLKARGERVGEYYLGWAGTGRHLVVYLSIFAVMAAGIVVASRSPSFQAMYPMYQQAGRSWFDLVVWELAYGLQFFALEFFFRGFMLHSLRRVLGYGAIFVMAVPYCMLHFQKPFMECILSIFGGIIIGTMAMRWRSVWGGALLHWLIALTMDLSAMIHRGEFPPGPLGP
jgi:membrane protease YdiL (CAAX protease family)